MEKFALTKEEFIIRSMAGESFMHLGNKVFYDSSKENPFRYVNDDLNGMWCLFDGKIEVFTLKQPEPKIERRWKYRKDYDGYTEETSSYYTDEKARTVLGDKIWRKVEDYYIDVEVRTC